MLVEWLGRMRVYPQQAVTLSAVSEEIYQGCVVGFLLLLAELGLVVIEGATGLAPQVRRELLSLCGHAMVTVCYTSLKLLSMA